MWVSHKMGCYVMDSVCFPFEIKAVGIGRGYELY